MTIESRYIGDSVYASYRDGGIIITAGHHEVSQAEHVIYLDPEVAIALIKYIEDVRKEHWRDNRTRS